MDQDCRLSLGNVPPPHPKIRMAQDCRTMPSNVPRGWLRFHYASIYVNLIQMDDHTTDSRAISQGFLVHVYFVQRLVANLTFKKSPLVYQDTTMATGERRTCELAFCS